MSNGSFQTFLDAMRAFESGWDRDRYDSGVIADWQLDEWAGGSVNEFYPDYSSWSELSDAEWDAMSYQSTNSLGFVGYQFGEALLIDLGYYTDDVFYGNGASTNTWDGEWTGKNGVTSLDDFKTAAAQETAIREAFGYNLQVIENGLANGGESLDDYLGTTRTYVQNGVEVTVELTLTGILAAAHLRGAWGTLSLLQSGDVSTDEYGTSILKYVEQFGGYDSPTTDEIIAFYTDGVEDTGTGDTGDTGTGDTGDTGDSGDTGDTGTGDSGDTDDTTDGSVSPDDLANSAITESNADVVIDWAWGAQTTVTDFSPETDTIFISWVGSDALEISETDGSTTFSIPSNNQSVTLTDVALADLVGANINALDATTRDALADLLSSDAGTGDGTDDGDGDDDGHDDDHGGMSGDMYMIDSATAALSVSDFDPETDMIHIDGDVTADVFSIFEENGDALGTTVRIAITGTDGTVTTHIFSGISLSDLDLGNFSIANEPVLNEVSAAIGATVTTPTDGEDGYTLSYDADGSNPAATSGTTDLGGVKYTADSNADDITQFDSAVDEIDFGGTSVHGMIITKSEAGEIVIDSPWSDAAQIVQGVTYQDVTIDSFGVVGNEHLRQDIGGVISWEQGVGPREDDTVYVRSHEYGVHEVVDNFDTGSMKISFLYFGTRERLTVEDTDDGLVISSLPTGQSMTFTGVALADLQPGQIEFHHDQVIEDNLEVPFGFDQEDVTLVDRTVLLTPAAPEGETTDGSQTSTGVWDGTDGGTDDGSGDGSGDTDDTTDDGGSVVFTAGVDTVSLDWSWAQKTTIEGFDAAEDVIDFISFNEADIAITEENGDLLIEVLGNGGNVTTLDGVQAEDLSLANLTADSWNTITDPNSALVQSLADLGMDLG